MKSLSARLTLWYAIASTVSAALFMVVGGLIVKQSYVDGIEFLNDKEFEEIGPRLERFGKSGNVQGAIEAIREHTERDASLFFFQVGHSHEDVFFISANMAGHKLPPSVHGANHITISDPELGKLRVSEYKAGNFDIHIASSLDSLDILTSNLLRVTGLLLVAIFLISVAVGFLLSRLALKPISRIEATAERITAKNLGERIEIEDTGDEISRLAKFLNSMFDRLQASFAQAQRFTADASHELKTPLALIRLNAERMKANNGLSEEEKKLLLGSQIELVDDLNKVVNDLLVLAKADAGALKIAVTKNSCMEFIQDFSEDAEILCEEKGYKYIPINEFDYNLNFDPAWIRHILFNLLSNALRFSPQDGSVTLQSARDGEFWKISILDEGPGVAEDKLDRIFERFYNDVDERGGKGSGLGLPLCRAVARSHGGSVFVQNRTERTGLIVVLNLPLDRNS